MQTTSPDRESGAEIPDARPHLSAKSDNMDIESLKAKVMQRARAFCAKKYRAAARLPYPVMEVSFAQWTVKRPYTATLNFWCDTA
jgi:hypothetical protein